MPKTSRPYQIEAPSKKCNKPNLKPQENLQRIRAERQSTNQTDDSQLDYMFYCDLDFDSDAIRLARAEQFTDIYTFFWSARFSGSPLDPSADLNGSSGVVRYGTYIRSAISIRLQPDDTWKVLEILTEVIHLNGSDAHTLLSVKLFEEEITSVAVSEPVLDGSFRLGILQKKLIQIKENELSLCQNTSIYFGQNRVTNIAFGETVQLDFDMRPEVEYLNYIVRGETLSDTIRSNPDMKSSIVDQGLSCYRQVPYTPPSEKDSGDTFPWWAGLLIGVACASVCALVCTLLVIRHRAKANGKDGKDEANLDEFQDIELSTASVSDDKITSGTVVNGAPVPPGGTPGIPPVQHADSVSTGSSDGHGMANPMGYSNQDSRAMNTMDSTTVISSSPPTFPKPHQPDSHFNVDTLQQILIPKEKIKIGSLIGAGGNAEVYRGFYGGEEVAIKVLKKTTRDFVGKDLARTFFETRDFSSMITNSEQSVLTWSVEFIPSEILQEIVSLERCRHPHVAHFYGVCLGMYEADSVWLVMELAQRGTLQDLLRKTSLETFNWKERQRMAYFISLGMEYLHSAPRNIFHADLKPANIIVTENGLPKVIDFGIAAFYGNSLKGMKAKLRGTLMYMAPEILMLREASDGDASSFEPEKADVYSYGVSLWVMVHMSERGGLRREQSSTIGVSTDASPIVSKPELLDVSKANETLDSYLDGFNLRVSMRNTELRDLDSAPLLKLVQENSSFGTGMDATPEGATNIQSVSVITESVIVHSTLGEESKKQYIEECSKLLFGSFETNSSYLQHVLGFRKRFGFVMVCNDDVPPLFRKVIEMCTQTDSALRPKFSELTSILYDF